MNRGVPLTETRRAAPSTQTLSQSQTSTRPVAGSKKTLPNEMSL